MARTKQTARKSTGGKAPRQQLATKATHELRSYLLNQQASGFAKEKKIFINCENTFGSFKFNRPKASATFSPKVCLSTTEVRSLSDPGSLSPLFMRMDFTSTLDGNLTDSDRQPLDIVFVVDVSGSMSCGMPDDGDRRNKLAIAQDCMRKITELLKPCDRVALVAFDYSPTVRYALAHATPANLFQLKTEIGNLRAGGGTSLAAGLQGGYDVLLSAADEAEGFRLKRVMFLTDMESSSSDESGVIALAQKHAAVPVKQHADDEVSNAPRTTRKRTILEALWPTAPSPSIHLTLVGIAVDLSVSAVERISAIPGARYVSVINAAEFFSTVVSDFNYDVTPIAFDIKVQLPAGLAFERIFGSAELNAVQAGEVEATISSEFPVFLDQDNCTYGGIYVCKLQVADASLLTAESALRVSWTDMYGTRHSQAVPLHLLPADAPAPGVPGDVLRAVEMDMGLRKAIALVEYVQLLTAFAVESNTAGTGTSAVAMQCSDVTAGTLINLGAANLVAVDSAEALPQDTPPEILRNFDTVSKFQRLKTRLLAELAAAGDDSLGSTNANVLQTVQQVIDLGTADVVRALDQLRSRIGARAPTPAADAPAHDIPRSLLCPITLAVMTDPVLASDGHSYERTAITTWLSSGRTTSPVTNLPLGNCGLIPNLTLRGTIEEFLRTRVMPAGALRRSARRAVAFANAE